jgi:hypothetical protein
MKKITSIIVTTLLLLGLGSCNDFLDVSSDSKYADDYVFGNHEEMNRALNTVYAYLLSGNTYGGKFYTDYVLNNDVEFTTSTATQRSISGNEYKLFDATPNASGLASTWSDAYRCIEYANNFITGVENSDIYSLNDSVVMQQLGEARCLRAMNYFDMVVLFGDLPFTFTRSYDNESLTMPLVDRDEILATLIDDLRKAAPYMSYARNLTDGIERASKEFCWSLIARIAMFRAGYSLRPDKSSITAIGTMQRPDDYRDYYEIARQYCDSVISSGTHSLAKAYNQVFIDECNYIVNNSDDPIFEIPFLKDQSGGVGYYWGPAGATQDDVSTGPNVWGGSSGTGVRLNSFYRYSFDRSDLRLNYVMGYWSYTHDGVPSLLRSYYFYCNKWSKFWTEPGKAQGAASTSANTGINYPYMRYADVLLMYAEAVNELEDGVTGPNGSKAIDAFKQVRSRAFNTSDQSEKVDAYIAASTSKDDFFKLIMNERKWEFSGENLRWKDLVRWNKYAEVIRDAFYDYYGMGVYCTGSDEYNLPGIDDFDKYPLYTFWRLGDNPKDINVYPNTTLQILDIYNLWELAMNPGGNWTSAATYDFMDGDGMPRAETRLSLRGYIYAEVIPNKDGQIIFPYDMWNMPVEQLPVVRYILPYPATVIARGAGAYQNYYGY